MDHSSNTRHSRHALWICLLLALVTAAVYWQVARNGFVNFDDPDYVSSNPRVQAGLTWESIRWAFTSYHSSNWHPLTWLSHMLDCQLHGLKPAGHHLTNLCFHVLNTLLLFGLLKRITGAMWRSAFVAAMFALHPLHVESVAWISERKDVLSTFFGLLCMGAYARYVECGVRSGECGMQSVADKGQRAEGRDRAAAAWLWYGGALVLFALGLMSKPMLVTLPCVMLLLDLWPLRRFQLSTLSSQLSTLLRLFLEKLPFFALSAASSLVTFVVQRASGAVVSLAHDSLEARLANAVAAYGWYTLKTLWPTDLAAFYPHPHLALDSWQVLLTLLLGIGATTLVVLNSRKRPFLLVGWLWFLGTLVPVIGLVQVGKQAWADRYMYLPQIGLAVMLAWGAAEIIARRKWPRLLPMTVAVPCLAGCAWLTLQQVPQWRNSRTLFEHAAAVTTGNYVAYTVVGVALADEGKLSEGAEYCRKALQLSPGYAEGLNALGNIQAKQEKHEEAITNYREAIRCDSTFAEPHHGLASVLLKQGKHAEAEAQCREALRLAPALLPAWFCLGTALQNQSQFDAAAQCYQRLLELSPNLFVAQRSLGNTLVQQGKLNEAIPHFLDALKIRPEDAETHAAFGVVLLDLQRIDEASAQFTEAARLQPTNAIAHYQLAVITQNHGQVPEAITHYRKALQSQPDWPEVLNNLAWILAANGGSDLRNGTEAIGLAERACSLTSQKEPFLLGTLAAAYAEAGRFKDAVTTAEKAIELATAAGQKDLADKNRELLTLYKAGKAYHEGQAGEDRR